MNDPTVQMLLTALLSAAGAWAAVRAELRALWRENDDHKQRIERLESKAMEV